MNKELYKRVLDLRNRISLDGDVTIYEKDYLLLDEVLDLIKNIGGEYIDRKFKKQEKLLKLYRELDDCIVASAAHYVRIRRQIKELENE